jgi:hypothetical protein
MDYVKPRTVEEISALADSMYEFELFDGIHSVESYGRYMICDSGHFEYDSNLDLETTLIIPYMQKQILIIEVCLFLLLQDLMMRVDMNLCGRTSP